MSTPFFLLFSGTFRQVRLTRLTDDAILHPRGVSDVMADQKTVLRLLRTARGQIDGIIKMVEENRYCIDISQQLMATEAILNRTNKEILAAHLKHCVQEVDTPEARSQKIDEFIGTLSKILT